MKRTKLTYEQLLEAIDKHNKENGVISQYSDANPLSCVIVFKNESWPTRKKNYTLKERSYRFRSDEKYFLPAMGGCSIFATTLAGTDSCRLDWYIGCWQVDYCYIENK